MKIKNLIFLFTTCLLVSFTGTNGNVRSEAYTTVYVCGKSTIYHPTKSHSALSRCTSGITTWTESNAKNAGKRACKCRN
ncbi:hypothetical protein QO206_12805 [Leeuwenhoekiella aequorea]|uniref:hypothetical protein n=1 Tax=Leeuwenhoekiella TaxID=283735 RepID=UPI00352F2A3D